MNNLDSVREPAVAGQFYPSDPAELRDFIEASLAECRSDVSSHVRAMIVPHAGYVYSGKVAAKCFASTIGTTYKNVVVISPTHRVPFRGLAACSYSIFRTPLGDMEVDRAGLDVVLSCGCEHIGRLDEAHAREHALEVELPFLQETHSDVKLVPLVCGEVNLAHAESIAEGLLRLWNKDTLWVISSDFTHYGESFSYTPFIKDLPQNIKDLDYGAIDKVLALDSKGFFDYIKETCATICGANPITLLLEVIRLSGQNITSELVDYTTSGALSGDYSHCVSYAGILFTEK